MSDLNPSAEQASALHRGPLRRICQHVAQGYEGQELGRTCPSAGLGAAGKRSRAGAGSGAGAERACGSRVGQRWLNVTWEMNRGERKGGWLSRWAFVFIH